MSPRILECCRFPIYGLDPGEVSRFNSWLEIAYNWLVVGVLFLITDLSISKTNSKQTEIFYRFGVCRANLQIMYTFFGQLGKGL